MNNLWFASSNMYHVMQFISSIPTVLCHMKLRMFTVFLVPSKSTEKTHLLRKAFQSSAPAPLLMVCDYELGVVSCLFTLH